MTYHPSIERNNAFTGVDEPTNLCITTEQQPFGMKRAPAPSGKQTSKFLSIKTTFPASLNVLVIICEKVPVSHKSVL